MKKFNKSKSNYYQVISNSKCGSTEKCDICFSCSIVNDKVTILLVDYINKVRK